MRYLILGVKHFTGEVEGRFHDNCNLRVLFPVSSRSSTESGYSENYIWCGKGAEYAKYEKLPFPIFADLEILNTAKGAELVSFKPLNQLDLSGSVSTSHPQPQPKG